MGKKTDTKDKFSERWVQFEVKEPMKKLNWPVFSHSPGKHRKSNNKQQAILAV